MKKTEEMDLLLGIKEARYMLDSAESIIERVRVRLDLLSDFLKDRVSAENSTGEN